MAYNLEEDRELENDVNYPLNIKEVADLIMRAEEYGNLTDAEIMPFVIRILQRNGSLKKPTKTSRAWNEGTVLAAAAKLQNAENLIAQAEMLGPLTDAQIRPFANQVWEAKGRPKNQQLRAMSQDWNKGKLLAAQARLNRFQPKPVA